MTDLSTGLSLVLSTTMIWCFVGSLLEEVVDFEPMSVPAPVVSEETTQRIEDIIKQRILDQVVFISLPEVRVHEPLQAWDDVERKVKPPEKPYDYQRARPLSQEKSKQSLAEVYEEKYVQSTKVKSLVLFVAAI